MSVDTLSKSAEPRSAPSKLPLAIRLALREFRAGLSGFYVFIACIALGVAVIAGVGALGDALRSSFERQGATLLGGDATLTRPHQRASASERSWIDAQGRVSETATVRSMARRTDGEDQILVEIKGVDANFPLVGDVQLSDGSATTSVRISDTLSTGSGVAVEPIVLERLGLKLGDSLQLGATNHVVRATIVSEPDKIADRLSVGPRLLMSSAALEKTGLIDPGSLVSWRYAINIKDPVAASAGLPAFADLARKNLPEGGFTIRDRRDPSPSVTKTLERLRQFLTLLGLTALLVGGVGVANAVTTYIDRRRPVIAILKAVGATTGTIFALHLAQIMLIAGIGVGIGLIFGLAVPLAIGAAFGSALPIQADIMVHPSSLATAAAYGLLVTLVFTLWPLGRAEQVRATALFRDDVAPENVWPRPRILGLLAACVLALTAMAILGSDAKKLAAGFTGAVVGVLAIFLALGTLAGVVARSVPRPRRPEIALAIGSIGAPGGLARSVVLSLGTGLSLLVAVALVDRSIIGELSGRIPQTSPNYFVLDVKKSEVAGFEEVVRRREPKAEIHTAPMLRGRIVKVNGTPAEQLQLKPEHQWVLNGDRGLSYAETVPEGSKVTAGTWWDANYAGEPLVSFEGELAKGLGLKIGDSVVVNVLGRNVTARLSNLREVKWESLAINFVMVFSPNTLRAAPHNVLATVTLPRDAPLSQEAAIARDIGKAYPGASAIRVKDAINQFNAIFGRIMTAIRAAGSITLAAGALVLAGALATAQRKRIKQAVILKALGATRRRILTSHLVEYGLLAVFTGLVAILVGSVAAWITVRRVMDLEFVFSLSAVAQAIGLALMMVGVFGGYGTWRVLQARPVPYLRSE